MRPLSICQWKKSLCVLATKSCEEVDNSVLIVDYPHKVLGHQLRPRTIHLLNISTLQLINNLTLVSVTKFILDSKIVFLRTSNLKTKTKLQIFFFGWTAPTTSVGESETPFSLYANCTECFDL